MNRFPLLSTCCALILGSGLIAADTTAEPAAPAAPAAPVVTAPATTAPAAPVAPVVQPARPMPIMAERYAVQLADLPEAVQKSLKEEASGKKTIVFIEKVSRSKKDGISIVTYHAEVAQEDGKLKAVIIDADGKVKSMPVPRMMQVGPGQPGQPGQAPIPMKRPDAVKADEKSDKAEKADKPAQ